MPYQGVSAVQQCSVTAGQLPSTPNGNQSGLTDMLRDEYSFA